MKRAKAHDLIGADGRRTCGSPVDGKYCTDSSRTNGFEKLSTSMKVAFGASEPSRGTRTVGTLNAAAAAATARVCRNILETLFYRLVLLLTVLTAQRNQTCSMLTSSFLRLPLNQAAPASSLPKKK